MLVPDQNGKNSESMMGYFDAISNPESEKCEQLMGGVSVEIIYLKPKFSKSFKKSIYRGFNDLKTSCKFKIS